MYQDYLDRAYAADQIYNALKRKARRKYGALVATTIVTAGVGSIPGIGAAVAGATGGAIAGDPKAAILAIVGAGLIGPQLSALGDVSQVAQITAHGVWGGVSSEILGGGFLEGFAGAAVGKAITVNIGPSSGFHVGQFAATVAGGAIAAELAGGNGAIGAATAAFGYVINQLGSYSKDSLQGMSNVAQSRGAATTGTANSQLMMMKDAAPYVGTAATLTGFGLGWGGIPVAARLGIRMLLGEMTAHISGNPTPAQYPRPPARQVQQQGTSQSY